MTSDASRRAIASAIWLRTQFPTQTKSTFQWRVVESSIASGAVAAVADELQEVFVDGGVVRQFRVEGGGEHFAFADEDWVAGIFGENFDVLPY